MLDLARALCYIMSYLSADRSFLLPKNDRFEQGGKKYKEVPNNGCWCKSKDHPQMQ